MGDKVTVTAGEAVCRDEKIEEQRMAVVQAKDGEKLDVECFEEVCRSPASRIRNLSFATL